jgi:hypothetical protein
MKKDVSAYPQQFGGAQYRSQVLGHRSSCRRGNQNRRTLIENIDEQHLGKIPGALRYAMDGQLQYHPNRLE